MSPVSTVRSSAFGGRPKRRSCIGPGPGTYVWSLSLTSLTISRAQRVCVALSARANRSEALDASSSLSSSEES